MYRELTVARIRTPDEADYVEVLFLESARIYEVRRDRPDFPELFELLQAAERNKRPVSIGFASLDSDLIEDVRLS